MKHFRKNLIIWLFEKSQNFYVTYFKKNQTAWSVTKTELIKYPNDTFGYHLGVFLKKNNFELIPKIERHDCYHVITGYETKVEDEIALQYLCFGNGKRSIYLFGVILLGTILLPDYFTYYLKSYKIGKNANHFYDFDYSKLLQTNIGTLRASIFINLTYA
tara:strand:+ start:300 stop:779 length:480 start_codon:yes stop_codon:yes gene_type:complete